MLETILETIDTFGTMLLFGSFLYSFYTTNRRENSKRIYKADLIFYVIAMVTSFYSAWFRAYQGRLGMAMCIGVFWAFYLGLLLRHVKKGEK